MIHQFHHLVQKVLNLYYDCTESYINFTMLCNTIDCISYVESLF